MVDINEVLKERNKVHGNYSENSHLAQTFKDFARNADGWINLRYTQRESVEMILCKIARMLAGDCNHIDHWQDISGYATLISKELSGESS